MSELFIELLSEEIPARMQAKAEAQLAQVLSNKLANAQLLGLVEQNRTWSGPRRIAVFIKDVLERQADIHEERRGPRADAPDEAIDGFLKGAGISRDDAEIRSTPKGDFLFAMINKKGRRASEIIPEILTEILGDIATGKIPLWPKMMRWGRSSKRWVRPLHRVTVIFDGKPLKGAFDLGGEVIKFGHSTLGHRMVSPQEIPLTSGEKYESALEKHSVIVCRKKRKTMINQAIAKMKNLTLLEYAGLMDEVVGLVEYPHPIVGTFHTKFLLLPHEILIASMRTHQKYFATLNKKGGVLLNKFVTIANMPPNATRDATIRKNNERVLQARLADAAFFWERDEARPLSQNLDHLSGIAFFEGLGTMREKADRISKLAEVIAKQIGADIESSKRAALLAKADLVSETVGEFPELQGIIGSYLAQESGENSVADAIASHYKPEGPGDNLPEDKVAVAVALADKIDTLVGFFNIGAIPTSSKDPYALRRSALGVIRIIFEGNYNIDLKSVFEKAASIYSFDSVPGGLREFMTDRMKIWMRGQGIRHDVVNAILHNRGGDLAFSYALAKVIADFLTTEDGQGLMAGYRRAVNILASEEKKAGKMFVGDVRRSILSSETEKELFDAVVRIAQMNPDTVDEAVAYLSALGKLRKPIDQFFEHNTVNDDDKAIRENRLNLLVFVRAMMMRLADFSQIEGG